MLHPHVQQALDAISSRPIENVFLVACGGSSALMYPSKYWLDSEAKTIYSDLYSSNEFIHRNPATLGAKSLVILCSHSGNTPETAEAAKFARSKGALTVSLTHEPSSPLAEASVPAGDRTALRQRRKRQIPPLHPVPAKLANRV